MKKMYLSLLFAGISISLLSGCATPKMFQAVGGSKSDGTVKLAYQYGGFQKPVVDQNQALSLAKRKCSVWGYDGAEAFGTGFSTCNSYNAYGCTSQTVSVEYQCTGETN